MTPLTDIIDRTPWIPSWHDSGACMDRRHILWLRYLLMHTKVERTLEIGVHTGASASAFIAAKVPEPHFADITHTLGAQRVIDGRGHFHQRKGCDILYAMPPFDLVLVDGNHSMDAVAEEIAALDAKPPRIIVAHDVCSTDAGYAHCEGAAHLMEHLRETGWLIVLDATDRPLENTKRGMMVATRDEALYQIAAETWAMTA
jgi:predicted O-methyltransferase YrrM